MIQSLREKLQQTKNINNIIDHYEWKENLAFSLHLKTRKNVIDRFLIIF